MPPCMRTPVPPISNGLGDLLVDLFEVEDVAFAGPGSFEGAVEGAEGAVLRAEVGVVDVAIDDVGDHALGVQAAAHGVGLKTQPDQVGRVEVVEGLRTRQRHMLILPSRGISWVTGFVPSQVAESRPQPPRCVPEAAARGFIGCYRGERGRDHGFGLGLCGCGRGLPRSKCR